MSKDYWDVILSSNSCREKIPYSDYISCHHWKNRRDFKNGPPLKCCKENCPIKFEKGKNE